MSVRLRTTFVVHFREWSKPTNTVRVAQRMLTRSRVLIRGGATPEAGRDTEQALDQIQPAQAVLLYPSANARPVSELGEATEVELIVPDGTWAQTRRLVRRHPVLQQLRHVRVDEHDTLYQLRRGAEAGLLCTLEAVAWALAVLEPDGDHLLLMSGFKQWQARALAYRGYPAQTVNAKRVLALTGEG